MTEKEEGGRMDGIDEQHGDETFGQFVRGAELRSEGRIIVKPTEEDAGGYVECHDGSFEGAQAAGPKGGRYCHSRYVAVVGDAVGRAF